MHPQAQVTPVRHGLPWLGFVVYPDHRRVKARNVHNFRHRLRERWQEYCAGEISFAEFDASVQGWITHVRYAVLGTALAWAGHPVAPAVKIKNRTGYMRDLAANEVPISGNMIV